ncbi:hypothetical protein ACP4OV_025636 [Aristida adscensionis]
MGASDEPLDPTSVGSVMRYDLAVLFLVHEAFSEALVYSELCPSSSYMDKKSAKGDKNLNCMAHEVSKG